MYNKEYLLLSFQYSIAFMLFLLYGKTIAGKLLNSDAILADANCTKVCIYMSAILCVSHACAEFERYLYHCRRLPALLLLRLHQQHIFCYKNKIGDKRMLVRRKLNYGNNIFIVFI